MRGVNRQSDAAIAVRQWQIIYFICCDGSGVDITLAMLKLMNAAVARDCDRARHSQ